MTFLVSVIIPTYDRKNMLEAAVDSALRQSVEGIEVIIVDDGSQDGTREHVRQLLDSRWRGCAVAYVHQENAGASAARNRGLLLAAGEYVQFLDADDLLLEGKFETQVAAMKRGGHGDPLDVCLSQGVMGDSNAGAYEMKVIGTVETNRHLLLSALVSRIVHVVPTLSPLWSRAFLLRNAPWREEISLGDDLEFHARLLCFVRGICACEGLRFFVREHEGARISTGSLSLEKVRSQFATRQCVYQQLMSAGLFTPDISSSYFRYLIGMYASALSLGNGSLIVDLESWMSTVSKTLMQRTAVRIGITVRRLFGPRFIIRSHAIFRSLATGRST